MAAERENPPAAGAAERYRLVVLGGGSAAVAAARAAAQRGVRVALLAPPRAPSPPPEPTPFHEQIRRAQARCGSIEQGRLPDEPGLDLYFGRPAFRGGRVVAVGRRQFRFRKAVIATGAQPAPVEIRGADHSGCLTPERLSNLGELPRRLAVIGSGPCACQWAQAFARFGSQVHLIGRDPAVLPGEETAACEAVGGQLERDGVRLHLDCREVEIETTGNLRGVVLQRRELKEKILVDRILACGPPRPRTAELGLEQAGIVFDDRGILVDDHLRTTAAGIFAAGAVCGPSFASRQAAEASARLAVHNALGLLPRRYSRLVVPDCIHTDPAVARVGLSHAEAAARRDIDAYGIRLTEADASLAEEDRCGYAAVRVGRRSGRIVGATVVARSADELISPLVMLMTRHLPLSALADVIPCRPGRVELLIRLARSCAEAQRSAGLLHRCRNWLCRAGRPAGHPASEESPA